MRYILSGYQASADNMKLVMASRMFYFICNWAVKHSLLLFYATLTVDRWPRISIYTMHFVAFTFGTTCIFVTIFQCRPINKMWRGPEDPNVHGTCLNIDSLYVYDTHVFHAILTLTKMSSNYFNSSFMLANDCVLYAMPLIFTWRLHVSRPQRIAVNLLFALGGLVLAASGARVYFVDVQARRPDFTHRFAMTMMCAVIENHLAIIVACAPSIKVILLLAFPSLEKKFEKFVSRSSSRNSGFSGQIDVECGLGEQEKRVCGGRPLSERTATDDSGKRREARKWWKPPSSWEVDRLSKDGCDVESSPGVFG